METLLTKIGLFLFAALVNFQLLGQSLEWSAYHVISRLSFCMFSAWQATRSKRWQLQPSYYSVCLAAFADFAIPQMVLRRVTAYLGLIMVAFSALMDYILPVVVLPKPRGKFNVGRTTRYWMDSSRPSWVSPSNAAPGSLEAAGGRHLQVDIWYPATSDQDQLQQCRRSRFVSETVVSALCESFHVPKWLMRHVAHSETNAFLDAPIDPQAGGEHGCPVVMFVHSLGGLKIQNTALMEELASHGYICVASDHPYDASLVVYQDGTQAPFLFPWFQPQTTPEGLREYRRQCIQVRSGDLHFMRRRLHTLAKDPVDPLGGGSFLDPTRVAMCGHSYGGGSVVDFAQQDLSVSAVVMLDGWLWCNNMNVEAGIPHPLLSIRSPTFMNQRDVYCSVNTQLTDRLCQATPNVRSAVVTAGHYDYTDMIWISPFVFRMLGLMEIGSHQRGEMHSFVCDETVAFLDTHLPLKHNNHNLHNKQSINQGSLLQVEWQDVSSLPLECEWTTMHEMQLTTFVDVIKSGEEDCGNLRFPKGCDLASQLQVLFCSHSKSKIRERLAAHGIFTPVQPQMLKNFRSDSAQELHGNSFKAKFHKRSDSCGSFYGPITPVPSDRLDHSLPFDQCSSSRDFSS